MEEIISDQDKVIQNEIRIFLSKHIKNSLTFATWEDDALYILMDRNKRSLTIEEKEKLKFLIAIGTPASFRSKLWFLCSGAKMNQYENSDYYDKLTLLSKEVPSLYEKQILMDIKRTHKGKSIDTAFYDKLRRILICYSIRNSSIGYCQGFNFICSRLLEVIEDEEDAFWVFVELIEEILPLDYYSELAGIIIDTTMITSLIKKYFPELKECYEQNGNMINTFIHKSLLGIFTQDYDEETSLLIWDFIFLEGNIVIIKTCLAIFGCINEKLCKCAHDDIEQLFTIFSSDIKNIKKNSNALLHSLAIKQFEFDEEFIESKREYLSNPIKESIEMENLEKIQEKLKKKNDDINEQFKKANRCNVDWPYCLTDFYFENMNEVISYLVLHIKTNPKVIDDYFFTKQKGEEDYISSINSIGNKNEMKEEILMNRRQHYCAIVLKDNNNGNEKYHCERKISNDTTTTTSRNSSNDFYIMIDNENNDLKDFYKRLAPMQHAQSNMMDGFDPEPFAGYKEETLGE